MGGSAIAELERVAPFLSVHVVSALEGRGLEALTVYLAPGQTSVLLGLSGVGKSTLVNRLLGEERQEVREIRSHDDRGRHTTNCAAAAVPPGAACSSIPRASANCSFWIADEGLGQTFQDVEEAATRCRFTDCGHDAGTPGCGVQAAIESGALTAERVASWSKVGRELTALARRQDKRCSVRRRSAGRRKRWQTESVTTRRWTCDRGAVYVNG